ncbi:SRPBCC family protein [Acinetobacter sp. ANC 4173]|uniref:SRPBCC family protein n=1 Tax=Acinetobacter sp. ANC 4173 TaxID=2529837 RepID=UPI00103CA898|nr:SRPBCC domain-containing protein [Acinetobacter sp. ANC 4173]TCB77715.1 SRPBCC domain-containing protein [Acinetobacter sp. ANC 4173]
MMEHLNFSISIAASPEKIWNILWSPDTYTEWTKFFTEGSKIQSDWTVGGRTLFIDSNGDGLIATILVYLPHCSVIFQYQGLLQGGVEDLTSPEVQQWQGLLEQYSLAEVNGKTVLNVELETMEDYKYMMEQAFEQGLQRVRELAEQ